MSEHNERVKLGFGSLNPIADTIREHNRYRHISKHAQVAMILGCGVCACDSAINRNKAAYEYK